MNMRQHKRHVQDRTERHPKPHNHFKRVGRYWGCIRLMGMEIGRYEGFRFIESPPICVIRLDGANDV